MPDQLIPEDDWSDRPMLPVNERTGEYQPDATVEYLPELHCRWHSRH